MTRARISAFFLAVFAVPLLAADWPMFHGPNGRNMSPDTGLLTSWPDGGPTLLWKVTDIGEGVSGYYRLSQMPLINFVEICILTFLWA